jgi:DNA-binding transcriptional LysR family regulator
MELRVLRYFLIVAREQNITKAADALHITQPTLSRQLKELEEELGKKLLVRGNKNVTLTEDGLLFRKRAEEIVELSDKTMQELKDNSHEISGEIFIGSGETEGLKSVIHIMEKMRKKYPNVSFHINSGDKTDLLDKLDKGLLDFGVFLEPVDKVKYNYLKLPAKDILGVLARKDSPLAKKGTITKEDLIDVPLIISRQLREDSSLLRWLDVPLENLDVVATYNLVYNASLMVDEGLGYAITLDKLVNTTGDSNLCFIPLTPKITVDMYLMWKKFQIFSKASDAFLEEIEKELQKEND